MKKFFVPAAIAALMGAGAWFGHTAATPADGLSDLQLLNAEALADPEAIDPNDRYGYKLLDCMDGDRLIGATCKTWSPSAVCNINQVWGKCND